jgi:hypothetical protein
MHLQLQNGLEMVKRSDQSYFFNRGIPSAGFESGIHEDLHRPTDDVEKIDFQKMQRVARLVCELIFELANRNEALCQ